MFRRVLGQWRITPSGTLIGLDYSAVKAALEMAGIKRREWPELFEQLLVMEDEALKVLNRK